MDLFTEVGNLFGQTLLPMQSTAHQAGLALFGMLALLTVVLSGIKIMLGSDPDAISTLARRMFGLAMLFSVVVFSRQIVVIGMNSAQDLATELQRSAGVDPILFYQPSTVIESWNESTVVAQEKLGELSTWTLMRASVPFLFTMSMLLIAQLLFAVTMLRYLLEAHVLNVVIPALVGFCGATATVSVAETSLSYLAGFCVRLVVLLLVAGLAPAITLSITEYIVENEIREWSQGFAVVGTGLAYAVVVAGLPGLVGRGMSNVRIPLGGLLR